MEERPSPSGDDFSMPGRGESAEYPPPEGGGIYWVHDTGFSRWMLTIETSLRILGNRRIQWMRRGM
jgi:hypothetical protein